MDTSLVNCPMCNRGVPDWYVNDHLDRDCAGMQIAAQDDSGNAESSESAARNQISTGPKTPSKRTTAAFLPVSPTSRQQRTSSYVASPFDMAKKARHDAYGPSILTSRDATTHATASGIDVDANRVALPDLRSPAVNRSASSDVEKRLRNKQLPLAERLRPLTLDSFMGQHDLVGTQGALLRTLIDRDQITSMVFWGNPGLGKTTLARIIARSTRASFKEMSAVTQNLADVKKVIEDAGNLLRLTGRRTILFLDEIHRFNKAQQDVFLPYLERGQIILIGATTENPSFKLNSALLSRCKVFHLEPLNDSDISQIAVRAARLKQEDRGTEPTGLSSEIAMYVAKVSNGDARSAISIIDIAMNALPDGKELDLDCIKQALQRSHIVYGEEEHYDLISALHKSVRGSDDNAALYWLGRMLQGGDDPLYIARRLVRMASEDIGLADSSALGLAVSTFQACQAIGMPECDTILAHCVAYLARAPKSVESYKAFNKVKAVVDAENPWPVPLQLRNAPTGLMRDMGYGKDYKYNPDYDGPMDQDYLPEEIKHYRFFDKSPNQ
ncbi:DNA-dependent ATPase mgs1 [Coemansia sp. RSA 1285]|nr:DNA-dependent ATPase mgs1 [Coemansia sp. RSA 1285]